MSSLERCEVEYVEADWPVRFSVRPQPMNISEPIESALRGKEYAVQIMVRFESNTQPPCIDVIFASEV